MKYKTLYTIHEGRMLMEKIVVPIAVGSLIYFSNEDNKEAFKKNFKNAKNFVTEKVRNFLSKKEVSEE